MKELTLKSSSALITEAERIFTATQLEATKPEPVITSKGKRGGEGSPKNTLFTPGDDFVDGTVTDNSGNDEWHALAGNDIAYSGNGDDRLWGNEGSDQLYGEEGNDKLYGGTGKDWIYGGDGDDVLIQDTNLLEGDYLNGGNGIDTADFSQTGENLWIFLDHNLYFGQSSYTYGTIENVENIIATNFNDNIHGDNNNNIIRSLKGNDSIQAMGGDDWIDAGFGDDYISGGTGIDTIDYSNASNGVSINITYDVLGITTGDLYPGGIFLTPHTATGMGTDNLAIDIENIIGSSFNDTIICGVESNIIHTGSGNDVVALTANYNMAGYNYYNADKVYLEDGDDFIITSTSSNSIFIYGGNGNDTVFSIAYHVLEYFLDAGNGNDKIYVGGGGGEKKAYGGQGDDEFIIDSVYTTTTCHGDEGDDRFIIQSRLLDDKLTIEGGAGADVFVFQRDWIFNEYGSQSAPQAPDSISILDFSKLDGDRIDFSNYNTSENNGSLDSFDDLTINYNSQTNTTIITFICTVEGVYDSSTITLLNYNNDLNNLDSGDFIF